jgi:hypothetical protein
MPLTTIADTSGGDLRLPPVPSSGATQAERIMAALGPASLGLPRVDQDSLARYYTYLSTALSLPITAYYPQPSTSREKTQFRCTVLELLDPTEFAGDEFDGIFCKTRKGRFEVNLPLIELHLPQDSPDLQLIEDYCYWFWNWR